jgi:SAM-dependent methyltransferase
MQNEHADPDSSGSWTYSETVSRGHYHKNQGGLFGKHDNVRTYWEDELTRLTLRPYIREKLVACAAANRGMRIVDLGAGSGEGFNLLTGIRQSDLVLGDAQRYELSPRQVALYMGLDLSESMLTHGRRNFVGCDQVRFEAADLREGLGVAAREAPFDVYFSSYGSLSHLTAEQLGTCLRAVVRHAAPGALLVLDMVGRYSPEWPAYWPARDEAGKTRPYSMSYLFSDAERNQGGIERFPLRFWTGAEVRQLAAAVSADTSVEVEPLELLDRSIFVGRHVDTAEYGARLPPLRRLVNRLFEHNERTPLEQLLITEQRLGDVEELNEYLAGLSRAWNTVVEFARTRLAGTRVVLVEMPGWREFPAPLQMALVTLDRIIDSVAWIDVGDVRANIIEPQLGYVLRRMQHRMQDGRGAGHGLVAVLRVGDVKGSLRPPRGERLTS